VEFSWNKKGWAEKRGKTMPSVSDKYQLAHSVHCLGFEGTVRKEVKKMFTNEESQTSEGRQALFYPSRWRIPKTLGGEQSATKVGTVANNEREKQKRNPEVPKSCSQRTPAPGQSKEKKMYANSRDQKRPETKGSV